MGIVKTPWVQSLNESGFESWLCCSPAINLVLTSVTLICRFSNTYTPTSKWDKICEVPNHNQACLQVLKQEVPTTCFLYTCSRTGSIIFVLVQFWIPTSFLFPSGDSSHKIPISNFEFGYDQATVLENLYRFIHTNSGGWPPIYCKVISTWELLLRHLLGYQKVHERYPKKELLPLY